MSKSTPIIDFQVHRLRHLGHTMASVTEAASPSAPPPDRVEFGDGLPDDEPSLVAALVVHMSKRFGRSLDALPSILREALDDLVSEGDPTARLLYAWIGQPQMTDQDILDNARQPDSWRSRPTSTDRRSEARIFRHRRFWPAGSLRLAEADQRRITRLRNLLAREIAHEQ